MPDDSLDSMTKVAQVAGCLVWFVYHHLTSKTAQQLTIPEVR